MSRCTRPTVAPPRVGGPRGTSLAPPHTFYPLARPPLCPRLRKKGVARAWDVPGKNGTRAREPSSHDHIIAGVLLIMSVGELSQRRVLVENASYHGRHVYRNVWP